jgi:hypothetical protein
VEEDHDALELFKAGSLIRLGDGKTAKFWTDAWLPGGKAVQELVPILFSFVRSSDITVAAALHNHRWVRDISGGLSTPAIAQYLHLWDVVEQVALNAGQPDEAIWRCSSNGDFSVSSAYSLFFIARTRFACAKPIWKSKAPMKCKFFMWLVVHKRCLTADNLARRGWPHNPVSPLCRNANEDCTHLFLHCQFSKMVWSRVQVWSQANFPTPSEAFQSTEQWWLEARQRAPKNLRRDFDTISILMHWRLWKERNGRIFQQEYNGADRVFERILDDIRTWRAASCILTF